MQKIKLIITGRYDAAIIDMRDDFIEFKRSTMTGKTKNGPFKIISVANIDNVKGYMFSGYEVHRSAYGHRHLDRAEQIAKALVR